MITTDSGSSSLVNLSERLVARSGRSDKGAAWSIEVAVAPDPHTPPETWRDIAKGSAFPTHPAVTALPDGEYVVLWQDDADGDGDREIWSRKVTAGGIALGKPTSIRAAPGFDCLRPRSTVAANGEIFAAWSCQVSESGDRTVEVVRLGSQLEVEKGPVALQQVGHALGWSPRLVESGGELSVFWLEREGPDGETVLVSQRLSRDLQDSTKPEHVNQTKLNAIALRPIRRQLDGSFVVEWEGTSAQSPSALYAQDYTSSGQKKGPEKKSDQG